MADYSSQITEFFNRIGHNRPYAAPTKPPTERPLRFVTCRINEEIRYLIELEVGAAVGRPQ
jgi:hypothetical protein